MPTKNTMQGWDDMLAQFNQAGQNQYGSWSSFGGGEGNTTDNYNPASYSLNGQSYTPVANAANTAGGTGLKPGSLMGFTTPDDGSQSEFSMYNPTGGYMGHRTVKTDQFNKYLPYMVGAALGGIGAFGGAGAAAGAEGATGLTELGVAGTPVGAGSTAMTGLTTPGATSALGSGAAGGAVGSAGGLIGGAGTGAGTGAGWLGSLFGTDAAGMRLGVGAAATLADIYAKNKLSGAYQDQFNTIQNKINGMYAPGSPEYAYLERQLQREAAASGRNSQVGQVQTDLAARIADKKLSALTGSLPQQNSILQQSLNNRYGGLSSLFFNLQDFLKTKDY